MLFSNQLLGLVRGVGVKRARSAALRPPTFDGLAERSDRGFIWTQKLLLIC